MILNFSVQMWLGMPVVILIVLRESEASFNSRVVRRVLMLKLLEGCILRAKRGKHLSSVHGPELVCLLVIDFGL